MASVRRSFFKYTMLPGLWPRIQELFASGFSFLAATIAYLYHSTGILPAGHPYLNPSNYGRYTIRNVLAEAGRNLRFTRQNIDQVIIYFTIVLGLCLLILQIILLCLSLITAPAMASTWTDIFGTNMGPSQDIAFIVLDNVFGIVKSSGMGPIGFFESCVSTSTLCEDMMGNTTNVHQPTSFPKPIHQALHKMLYFYTSGIAFISIIVILYYVVAIIGETVTSGTPFGQRTNRAWTIPRMILFFALIAPFGAGYSGWSGYNEGINMAQLITFHIAKFGSNMATNAWIEFVDTAAAPEDKVDVLGNNRSLIAKPSVPDIGNLTQFMHVARMCMVAEEIMHGHNIHPYFVRKDAQGIDINGDGTINSSDTVTLHDGSSVPYLQMGGTSNNYLPYEDVFDGAVGDSDFERVLAFSRYETIVMRFGHHDPSKYPNELGNVQPTCGELHMEVTSTDEYVVSNYDFSGADGIQAGYFHQLMLYMDEDDEFVPSFSTTAECMARAFLPYDQDSACVDQMYDRSTSTWFFPFSTDTRWLSAKYGRSILEYFQNEARFAAAGIDMDWGYYGYITGNDPFSNISTAYKTAAYERNLLITTEMRERGWAGAALWYNQIANINGTISEAVRSIPRVNKYPMVMEQVADYHKRNDSNMSYSDRFNPRLQNGKMADLPRRSDQYIAALLYADFSFWNDSSVQETIFTRQQGNAIIDVLNMILGTTGLFDMLKNEAREVHPLASLSALGKSMVDASLRNMFIGIVGQGIGQVLSENFIGQISNVASGFAFKFGMIGLSIGFILYYILPFLPFIYFFFAFSGWVKSIFEAVVAMPLWALSHLRIDGEGLPGPIASNGYFLLFEILLRPILIIFGFVISISLFSALVEVLHSTFITLTYVVSGFDMYHVLFADEKPDVLEGPAPFALPTGTSDLNYWRGPLDAFFYSAIYTIIVYMIGLSCFKLVDAIPNHILRWMGATVSTFHEQAGDPAGEMTGKAFRSGQMANAQLMGLMARTRGQDHVTDAMLAQSMAKN